MRLPDGWSSDRSRFEFAGVNWNSEKRKSIRLSAPPEAGAARAVVAWESDEGDGECVWPLIRLGDGRSVETAELERHGRRLLALDNGILRLELAPGYGGAAPGLFKGKTNRLQSPFPAIGAIDRIAPFHGGILPFLEALRGPLRRETFEGEFPADEEANGFLWRGVRERVAICNDERLCGLILEYGFWTVGGAKTIRLGVRAINRTGVRQRPHVGFAVFARPGGTESDPILFAPGIRLKPGPLDRTAPEGEYAGALDPVSGKAIVLAGRLSAARIQRFGAQACALFYTERLNLNPGAAAEAIAYLSLAKNEEEALAYSALGQCMNRTDRRA
ncbi:MAG: hypothetical protein BWZ10_00624 [candidate division BRC1 bacterium ADurb.BinA364]|nr:MAG: hypothetical protein BWZ10_00624 [candidate division BRC1 bacterium ADurb.BinA364]